MHKQAQQFSSSSQFNSNNTNKVMQLQESELLIMIMEYLKRRNYISAYLELEKESETLLEPSLPQELSLIRNMFLQGDYSQINILLKLLKNKIVVRQEAMRELELAVAKQRFLEQVDACVDADILVASLQNISAIATPNELTHLYHFLTLPSVRSHPDYSKWNVLSARFQTFLLIRPYLEETNIIQTQIQAQTKSNIQKNDISSKQDLDSIIDISEYVQVLSGFAFGMLQQKEQAYRMDMQKLGRIVKQQVSEGFVCTMEKVENEKMKRTLTENTNMQASMAVTQTIYDQQQQPLSLAMTFGHSNNAILKPDGSTLVFRPATSFQPSLQTVKGEGEEGLQVIHTDERIDHSSSPPMRPSPNSKLHFSESKNQFQDQQEQQISSSLSQNSRLELYKHFLSQSVINNDNNNTSNNNTNSNAITQIEQTQSQEQIQIQKQHKPQNVVIKSESNKNDEHILQQELKNKKVQIRCKFKVLKQIALIESTNAIRAASFSPQGSLFAIGTNSRHFKLYRFLEKETDKYNSVLISRIKELCEMDNLHQGSIFALDWSTAGNLVATGSIDKTVKIMLISGDKNEDNLKLKNILTLQGGHTQGVRCLRFCQNDTVLLSAGNDCIVKVWDIETGQAINSMQGHAGAVYSMAIGNASTGREMCATCGIDKFIRFWDISSNKLSFQVPTPQFSPMNSLVFGHNSNNNQNNHQNQNQSQQQITDHTLLVAHDDGIVTEWDIRNTICSFRSSLAAHEQNCRSVDINAIGNSFCTSSFDKTINIFDIQSHQLKFSITDHSDRVVSAQFHPFLPVIISASADKTVRLFEESNLEESEQCQT